MGDYYKTLGINRDASAEEIRKAYKRRARKYHPDVRPGDKDAATKFKKIQRAYAVLRDPEKRARYDRRHAQASDGGRPSGPVASPSIALNQLSAVVRAEWAPQRARVKSPIATASAAFVGLGILVVIVGVAFEVGHRQAAPIVAVARHPNDAKLIPPAAPKPAPPHPATAPRIVAPNPVRQPLIAQRPAQRPEHPNPQQPQPIKQQPAPPVVKAAPIVVPKAQAKDADPRAFKNQQQDFGRLGRELFPKVTSRVNVENAAAEALNKCFKGFPANCWRADDGRKVTVVEKNARAVKLLIEFSIVQDRKAYSDLIKRTRPLLMQLSKGRGNPPPVRLQRDSTWPGLVRGRMPFGSKDASSAAANYQTGDSMLFLNTTLSGADERSQKSGWTCFVFDKNLEPSLNRLRRRLRSRILLLDGNKKTLAQGYEQIGPFQYGQGRFGVAPSVTKSEIPIGQTEGRMPVFFLGPVLFASPEDSFSGHSSLILPGDGQNDGGIPFAFSHGVSCGHIFSLSLDELKALDHITVEVISADVF